MHKLYFNPSFALARVADALILQLRQDTTEQLRVKAPSQRANRAGIWTFPKLSHCATDVSSGYAAVCLVWIHNLVQHCLLNR